jgi:hypothetical protein
MKRKYLLMILMLLLTVSAMFGTIRLVSGAVVYTSTIEVNHARDSNGNDLQGTIKIINLDNGTIHGPYSLNSTGGYSLNGLGNATNYRIEIYWQGSKVNQTTVTTSAVAGTINKYSPINCRVAQLSFSFQDSNSPAQSLTIVNFTVIAPNGTSKTLTSTVIPQAQNGTWTITSVMFENVNVVPSPNPSYSFAGTSNASFPTVSCLVYSLSGTVKDLSGDTFNAQITITKPDGSTVQSTGSYSDSQEPVGQYNVSISWSPFGTVQTYSFTLSEASSLTWTCSRLEVDVDGRAPDVYLVNSTGTLSNLSCSAEKLTFNVTLASGYSITKIAYGEIPERIFVGTLEITDYKSATLNDMSRYNNAWYFDDVNDILWIKIQHTSSKVVEVYYQYISPGGTPWIPSWIPEEVYRIYDVLIAIFPLLILALVAVIISIIAIILVTKRR